MNEKQKRLFFAIGAMLLIVSALIPSDGSRLASPVRLIFPVVLLVAIILIKKFYGGTSES